MLIFLKDRKKKSLMNSTFIFQPKKIKIQIHERVFMNNVLENTAVSLVLCICNVAVKFIGETVNRQRTARSKEWYQPVSI